MNVVGYTYAPWDHALAMLRIVGPIQQAGLTLIRGNESERIAPELVSKADLVLLQRDFPHNREAYAQIMRRARAEGKPVILDLDDLLLELPENHPDKKAHQDTNVLFSILRGVIEADAVTTSTMPLAEYLRAFNPNTWLLPNYLNDQIWSFHTPGPDTRQAECVVIGYMGGSSHMPDLESITPALVRLLEKYENSIVLKFYGVQPPVMLSGYSNVEWTPLNITSYQAFAEFFSRQQCDILIAPLADNLFNRCKSEIKFLEYSALGVPGVYSRITPYEGVVEPGVNGFLAATQQEWEHYLAKLIESPALRGEMGAKARQTVHQHWRLSQHAPHWAEVYRTILASSPTTQEAARQRMASTARVLQQGQHWQEELLARLAVQEDENQTIQSQLAEKERLVQELAAQITEMKRNRAWKLASSIKSLRVVVAPSDSRRERLWLAFSKWLGGKK